MFETFEARGQVMFRESFATGLVAAVCVLEAGGLRAQDMPLSEVLVPGEGWELIGEGYMFTEGPAADRAGNVHFTDVRESRIYKADASGKVSLFAENTARTNGLMFGPDDRLYGCRNGDRQVVAYKADGTFDVIANGVDSNDLVVASDGGIYFTDPPGERVWYVSADGGKRVVASGFWPNGLILTPDEGTLVVTDSNEPHLWAYHVAPDGGLAHGDRYFGPLRLAPGSDRPGSDGLTVDREGRVYVATLAGIQVFDPTGRPSGVILRPHEKRVTNVTFGGPKFEHLYATCTDRVYRRRTRTAGR